MNYPDYLKADCKRIFTVPMFFVYLLIGAVSLWNGERVITVVFSLLAGLLIGLAIVFVMSFIRYKRKKPIRRKYRTHYDWIKERFK